MRTWGSGIIKAVSSLVFPAHLGPEVKFKYMGPSEGRKGLCLQKPGKICQRRRAWVGLEGYRGSERKQELPKDAIAPFLRKKLSEVTGPTQGSPLLNVTQEQII